MDSGYYSPQSNKIKTRHGSQTQLVTFSPPVEGPNKQFELILDISHHGDFKPNEISVRVIHGHVSIVGRQLWRDCPGGAMRRSFDQRHVLPANCDKDQITATVTTKNLLVIKAPTLSSASIANQIKRAANLGTPSNRVA